MLKPSRIVLAALAAALCETAVFAQAPTIPANGVVNAATSTASLAPGSLATIFGHSESLCAHETLQFEDYSKVVFTAFDPEERRKRRETVFPQDCRKAFELGARLVRG